MPFNMIPIVSTALKEVGYDPAAQKLRVITNSGACYEYDDVSVDQYRALRESRSAGTWWRDNLMGKHAYRAVDLAAESREAGGV
jgi:hypothetical protein